MPISCNTDDLAEAAKCFQQCIPAGMMPAVQTYLLAVIAGGSTDPAVLMASAKCFFDCIPPGMQKAVQSYLLCQIANT